MVCVRVRCSGLSFAVRCGRGARRPWHESECWAVVVLTEPGSPPSSSCRQRPEVETLAKKHGSAPGAAMVKQAKQRLAMRRK
jgi:hypothetical protein